MVDDGKGQLVQFPHLAEATPARVLWDAMRMHGFGDASRLVAYDGLEEHQQSALDLIAAAVVAAHEGQPPRPRKPLLMPAGEVEMPDGRILIPRPERGPAGARSWIDKHAQETGVRVMAVYPDSDGEVQDAMNLWVGYPTRLEFPRWKEDVQGAKSAFMGSQVTAAAIVPALGSRELEADFFVRMVEIEAQG